MDKRTHIINTALNTFYQKGIHSVGINEILKLANVAKKTLYNHFVSKDELVCACLELRDQCFNQWLSKHIADCKTPQQVASALFSAIASWIDNKAPELGDFNGCFFINTAAEYPQPDHPIALQCKAHKQAVLDLLITTLSQTAQLQNQTAKATQLAQLLMTLKEGMICQARVTHTTNHFLQNPEFLAQLMDAQA